MESRSSRPPGPPDYPLHDPVSYVNYGSDPPGDPSWREALLKTLVTIATALILTGTTAVIAMFFSINSRLAAIEAHEMEGRAKFEERQQQMEKHLESNDRRIDEMERQIPWHRQ